MSTVALLVSGSRFEINYKCLEAEPFQRLPLMVKEAIENGKSLEFKIDRPVERFAAILAYYQTGELHIPAGVCPGAFQKELLYWYIDSDKLSECCMARYILFLDEQETARKFRQDVLRGENSLPARDILRIPVKSGSRCVSCKNRLWNIIDNNEASFFAKAYFLFLFLVIMASIFSLAFRTEEAFTRKLTKCEMLEYLEYTRHEGWETLSEILGNPECDDFADFGEIFDWDLLQERMEIPWLDDVDENTSATPTEATNNLPSATTEHHMDYAASSQNDRDDNNGRPPLPDHSRKQLEIPQLRVHSQVFDIIDIVLMSFFTLDLFLRLICCPSFPRYFLSVINVLDAIALVSTYIHVTVIAVKKDQKYIDNWLDFIEYFQILRTIRLFRIVKNVRATKVLVYAVKESFQDLMILLMFLFIAVCTFASVVYFAEDRSDFKSIPTGWWWALVTLTTVGYGDVAPKTVVGRLVGSACAITGVILIALTLPIFVNNFLMLYQYAMVDDVLQRKLESKTAQNTQLVSYPNKTTMKTESADVTIQTKRNRLPIVST